MAEALLLILPSSLDSNTTSYGNGKILSFLHEETVRPHVGVCKVLFRHRNGLHIADLPTDTNPCSLRDSEDATIATFYFRNFCVGFLRLGGFEESSWQREVFVGGVIEEKNLGRSVFGGEKEYEDLMGGNVGRELDWMIQTLVGEADCVR